MDKVARISELLGRIEDLTEIQAYCQCNYSESGWATCCGSEDDPTFIDLMWCQDELTALRATI